MGRLIDADATEKYLNDKIFGAAGKIKAWMDAQPTVDAVKVVRCEKCKFAHRQVFMDGQELYLCTRIGKDSFVLLNEGDKYCAYGERREKNDEA